MTEPTREEYEAALQVVADRESILLNEMLTTFTALKAEIVDAQASVDAVKNELPDNSLPSNIRAIVEQYRGQLQNFNDQVSYMVQTTQSNLAQYNPPAGLP